MRLKREYTLNGKKMYYALTPETATETAIIHLLSKEYPDMFEFVSELTTGGLYEVVYLKIKEADGKE